jgi:hypothetical protein
VLDQWQPFNDELPDAEQRAAQPAAHEHASGGDEQLQQQAGNQTVHGMGRVHARRLSKAEFSNGD